MGPGRYRFRLYEAKAQNVLPTMSHKAMICDQGSNNCQLLESFEKVTCDRPFITVNHNPVFVTYDSFTEEYSKQLDEAGLHCEWINLSNGDMLLSTTTLTKPMLFVWLGNGN